MFRDTSGASSTIHNCQKKIDHMWQRLKKYPKAVESTPVGKFSFVDTPRGFCILKSEKRGSWEVVFEKYNL